MKYITLYNGVKMPILGFGVWQVKKEDCVQAVLTALKVGYRMIDTAQCYFNEEEVGEAIALSGIPRNEIFITTKVWISNYGYEKCKASVYESLRKLKTDYIDLMLLHQNFNDTYGAWRALEELYEEGIIKAIGVSNFYPDRLVDFVGFNRIKPMVNQLERHLMNQKKIDIKYAKKYGVVVEAYSPLGMGKHGVLDNKIVIKLAKKYNKSPAQILLRWTIQSGLPAIPKSVHEERIKENFDIFDFKLTRQEMSLLNSLDKKSTLTFKHQTPQAAERYVDVGNHFDKLNPNK